MGRRGSHVRSLLQTMLCPLLLAGLAQAAPAAAPKDGGSKPSESEKANPPVPRESANLGTLEFYINGTKTWTYSDPRVGSVPAWMLLSAQVGGWGGNYSKDPLERARYFDPSLPRHLYVDYVKVWSGRKAK